MSQPNDQDDSVPLEGWNLTGPSYGSTVGRMSVFGAARLIDMANDLSPITPASKLLDNGAGTGVVTVTAATKFPGTTILATDTAPLMLEDISAKNLQRVSTKVLDARSLTKELPLGDFTHAFATFMLHTIKTPHAVLSEMSQVLCPSGTIAIAIWGKRIGNFEIWERSCQAIDPTYTLSADFFEDSHAWRTREELEAALSQAGFGDIRTEDAVLPYGFDEPDGFIDFWFGTKNPNAARAVASWKEDLEPVKQAMRKVLRDGYDNGKGITNAAVLGVGKKL